GAELVLLGIFLMVLGGAAAPRLGDLPLELVVTRHGDFPGTWARQHSTCSPYPRATMSRAARSRSRAQVTSSTCVAFWAYTGMALSPVPQVLLGSGQSQS